MIRVRRRLVTLLSAVAVAVGVLSACSPETATAPTGDLTLYATFADAQDLTAGHSVQVSNVIVGSVRAVRLDGYQARVRLSIVNGRRIPIGTSAVVRRTSLLGEHYVDLVFPDEFSAEDGPFLENDAEIGSTDTQPDFEQLAGQAAQVIGAITADDLSATVNALALGIGGRGATLNRLVDQLAQVVGVLADQRVNLTATVDGLARLGATLAPASEEIGTLIGDLGDASETIVENTDRIFVALEELVRLTAVTNDTILVPHADELAQLLGQLDPIVADLVANRAMLESLIVNLMLFSDRIETGIHNGQILVFAWAFLQSLIPGQAAAAAISGTAASGDPTRWLAEQLAVPTS